jgi:outer membrane protein
MKRFLIQVIILSCALGGGKLAAQDSPPGREGTETSTQATGTEAFTQAPGAEATPGPGFATPILTETPVGRNAAKRWTLRECIEYAQCHNIQLLQQELSQEDAKIAHSQSRLDYLPSINASAGAGVSFNRVLQEGTYEFLRNSTDSDMSLSVSAGMDLFAGMKKLHTLKLSELNLKANLLSTEKMKDDLALNITAAYLEILFSEEKVKIAEAHIQTISMQVDQTQKLVEAGKNTVSDLLQMQAQLAEAEHDIIIARNQRTLAYFNLCQMLEIEDFMNFAVMAPEELVMDMRVSLSSVDEIMETARNLPQIGQARLNVEIADRNIRLAGSAYYPSLYLSAGYGSSWSELHRNRMNFGTQLKNFAQGSISLNLSIPIFNSLSTRNNVKSQKISLQRAEYDMLIVEKQLKKEIQQALIDANGAMEQYDSSLKNVATTEESFRIIEQRYSLGTASPVDYSVALYNLINARSQLTQAKYQYIFKTTILDFYKGNRSYTIGCEQWTIDG